MSFLKNINYTINTFNRGKINSFLFGTINNILKRQVSINYISNVCNSCNNFQHNFISTYSNSNLKCNFKLENRLIECDKLFRNYYGLNNRFSEASSNYHFCKDNNGEQQEEYTQDKKYVITDLIIHYIKSLIFLYFVHDCIFEISSVSNNKYFIFTLFFISKINYFFYCI